MANSVRLDELERIKTPILILQTPGVAPAASALGPGERALFLDAAGQFRGVDTAGALLSLSPVRKENALVNGSFRFAQRQAPGTLTTYSNTSGRAFGADRWGMTNENASAQFIRTDASGTPETGLQARYYGTYKKITSTGKMIVSQVIEGVQTVPLRGRTVRLQLKLKASTATTVRVALLQLAAAGTIDSMPATFASAFGADGTDPTWGTNLAKIAPVAVDNATIASTGLTCAVTTAWQRFGGTFLIPTDCKNLVVVIFTNAGVAANVTVSIAEAGVFDGGEIQDYVPRPYAQELSLVQRFFQKTFAVDTAPIQNAGVNTGELKGIAGVAAATAQFLPWRFPVTMRAAPTATLYSPAAASAQVYDETAAAVLTASSAAGITENSLHVTATGNAGGAVGDLLGVHVAVDAEI